MQRSLCAIAVLLTALLVGAARAEGAAPVSAAGRALAVTVDDLPFVRIDQFDKEQLDQGFTRLLSALTEAGVEAVGFVNERKLYRKEQLDDSRVALLQQWLDAGMELGNHTYSHLSLNAVGTATFEADILHGEHLSRQLMKASGKELRYFRYPFLHLGRDLQSRREVERFLHKHGYTIAPVTILGQEWQFAAAYDNAISKKDAAMGRRIGQSYIEHMGQAIVHAEKLANDMFGHNISQVLLLHANMLNADYFPLLASQIRQRGYRFAPLGEVLRDPAYRTPDTYTDSSGESRLYHWLMSFGIRPEDGPACPDFVKEQAGNNSYNGD